uniref:Uncharacterized protein n=1 Tax=viral metagenome TaxID=1070528 RepID=A0A6M3KZK4_9ZZZZ
MLNFEFLGLPLTHQKVVPGNTITSLSEYCYKYRIFKLNFDAGTDEIVANDWVVGATSGAVGRVKYISVTSGTWAGDNVVGYLLIDSWNGTAWTNNEKIKVAADATMADVNQAAAIVEATDAEYTLAGMLIFKHMLARTALVVCYANTALTDDTGGKPDQTALIGTPMVANASYLMKSYNAIKNFKAVDYTAASASILQVKFCF